MDFQKRVYSPRARALGTEHLTHKNMRSGECKKINMMCRREGQLFLNLRAWSLNETSGAKLSVYYYYFFFNFLSSWGKEERFFLRCVPGKQLRTIIHIRVLILQLIKEISDITREQVQFFKLLRGKKTRNLKIRTRL